MPKIWNLSANKLIRYRTYQIPNLSDTKLVRYWAFQKPNSQIPNLSNTEHIKKTNKFWTYSIQNLLDIKHNNYLTREGWWSSWVGRGRRGQRWSVRFPIPPQTVRKACQSSQELRTEGHGVDRSGQPTQQGLGFCIEWSFPWTLPTYHNGGSRKGNRKLPSEFVRETCKKI